ncbi:PTS sugar transporter subunit IIB [Metabacillus iocasae]|uniref:PTS system ascorbate-specific IIB component n=1 Tax=Priestia iocasae TaxID=2291674 RepID=A0ABS2QSI4_9BACI|nr:PTS sugar transporter subunit IIB [Metabacillus iocasae]MBM7702389.1 PTS system ascorbate-specific IIB component [Metabacillus iocasae]
MKILTVCGSGLGSSFMLEMNINSILAELGVTNVEVNHSDVSSATSDMADLFIVAKDIAESVEPLGDVLVLNSIIDMDELREKLTADLTQRAIL